MLLFQSIALVFRESASIGRLVYAPGFGFLTGIKPTPTCAIAKKAQNNSIPPITYVAA